MESLVYIVLIAVLIPLHAAGLALYVRFGEWVIRKLFPRRQGETLEEIRRDLEGR